MIILSDFFLFINLRRLRFSNSFCLIVSRNLNSVNATILRIWSSRHLAILRIPNRLYSIVSRNLDREYETILKLWNRLYSTVLRISNSLSLVEWIISIILFHDCFDNYEKLKIIVRTVIMKMVDIYYHLISIDE